MASISLQFVKKLSSSLCRQYKYVFSPHFSTILQFSCSSSTFNIQRRFGEKHEWIAVDGNIGTVGVTSYAQESLGEVVYVQLPDIGLECQADEDVGVIESVKAVNEMCSPVSGRITEVNTKLEDKPGLINESCYDEGWIFKLELKDAAEMDKLMTEKQYEEYLKSME